MIAHLLLKDLVTPLMQSNRNMEFISKKIYQCILFGIQMTGPAQNVRTRMCLFVCSVEHTLISNQNQHNLKCFKYHFMTHVMKFLILIQGMTDHYFLRQVPPLPINLKLFNGSIDQKINVGSKIVPGNYGMPTIRFALIQLIIQVLKLQTNKTT